jgi:hypothetical protein
MKVVKQNNTGLGFQVKGQVKDRIKSHVKDLYKPAFAPTKKHKISSAQEYMMQTKDPRISCIEKEIGTIEKEIGTIEKIKEKLKTFNKISANIFTYKEKSHEKYSNIKSLVDILRDQKGVELLCETFNGESHVFFAFRDRITINDYKSKLSVDILRGIKNKQPIKSIKELDKNLNDKNLILEKRKQELILLQAELEQELDQENQQHRANLLVVDLSKKYDSKISVDKLDTEFHDAVPKVNAMKTWITEEEQPEAEGDGNFDKSFFDDEDYYENLLEDSKYDPHKNTIEHNTNQHRESDLIYSSEAKPPKEDLLMNNGLESLSLSLLFNKEDIYDFGEVYKKIDNSPKKINFEEVSVDIFEERPQEVKIEQINHSSEVKPSRKDLLVNDDDVSESLQLLSNEEVSVDIFEKKPQELKIEAIKSSPQHKSITVPKEIAKISIKKDRIINQPRDSNKSRDSISTKKERNKVIGHNYHYSSISYADRKSQMQEMRERLRNIYEMIRRILYRLEGNIYYKSNIYHMPEVSNKNAIKKAIRR